VDCVEMAASLGTGGTLEWNDARIRSFHLGMRIGETNKAKVAHMFQKGRRWSSVLGPLEERAIDCMPAQADALLWGRRSH